MYCGRTRAVKKCKTARQLGVVANRAAGKRFKEGSVQWDAFKHVYWHALMVKKGLGFKWSQGFGRAYENYSGNKDGPGDIVNNRHGAVIGQLFKEGKLHGRIDDYVEHYINGGYANTTTNCAGCS